MTHPTQSAVIQVASGVATFAERQQEKFPLNTFFSLQTFRLYYGTVDLLGSILEYPLALIQQPLGSTWPSRDSEIQNAINCSRYRNINTDII